MKIGEVVFHKSLKRFCIIIQESDSRFLLGFVDQTRNWHSKTEVRSTSYFEIAIADKENRYV